MDSGVLRAVRAGMVGSSWVVPPRWATRAAAPASNERAAAHFDARGRPDHGGSTVTVTGPATNALPPKPIVAASMNSCVPGATPPTPPSSIVQRTTYAPFSLVLPLGSLSSLAWPVLYVGTPSTDV